MTKILILRFSSLGDLILTTPFYRELKRLNPSAELHLATSTNFAPLLENNPHLTKIHALNRQGGQPALRQLVKRLQAHKWDQVFDLHRSLRSRLLLFQLFGLFPAWKTQLYRLDKRSWQRVLLLRFKRNVLQRFPAQREAYLQLIGQAYPGAKLQSHTELFPSNKQAEAVTRILTESGINEKPLIGFGAGASFPLKRWPKESFLFVARELAKQGYQPIFLGGGGEEEPDWIAKQGGFPNWSGRLDFLETAALLARCSLAVSNDSAIVHFAEAMGTPALALFGPTVKEFGFGPFLKHSLLVEKDLPCRPCSRNGKGSCSNQEELACLRQITAEEVLQLALERLKKAASKDWAKKEGP